MKPVKVSKVNVVFGGDMEVLLPKFDTLPEEFQRERHPFCRLAQKWFSTGLNPLEFEAKPGIDPEDAWNHLRAIMVSFAPKHEHKIAGVGYLMNEWFTHVP